MSGQNVGYVRVSSLDQNPDRQLETMTGLDRVFTDKLSGKDTQRPELQAMLAHVRAGDTVHVHSLDRLARNLSDLRALVADMTGRGVTVVFAKESLTFTGDDDAMSMLLLNMMGAFAEFERALLRERQREGIALAKAAGKYQGGRRRQLSEKKAAELVQKHAEGVSVSELGRTYELSRQSVYAYLSRAS